MGVGVLRKLINRMLRPLNCIPEELELTLLVIFQVVGIYAGRLVGHCVRGNANFISEVDRPLKIAGVKRGPGLKQRFVVGEGLAVSAVQFGPDVPERPGIVAKGGSVVGKWIPLGHESVSKQALV